MTPAFPHEDEQRDKNEGLYSRLTAFMTDRFDKIDKAMEVLRKEKNAGRQEPPLHPLAWHFDSPRFDHAPHIVSGQPCGESGFARRIADLTSLAPASPIAFRRGRLLARKDQNPAEVVALLSGLGGGLAKALTRHNTETIEALCSTLWRDPSWEERESYFEQLLAARNGKRFSSDLQLEGLVEFLRARQRASTSTPPEAPPAHNPKGYRKGQVVWNEFEAHPRSIKVIVGDVQEDGDVDVFGADGNIIDWTTRNSFALAPAHFCPMLFEAWERNGVVPDFEVEGYEAWKVERQNAQKEEARKAAQQQEEQERQQKTVERQADALAAAVDAIAEEEASGQARKEAQKAEEGNFPAMGEIRVDNDGEIFVFTGKTILPTPKRAAWLAAGEREFECIRVSLTCSFIRAPSPEAGEVTIPQRFVERSKEASEAQRAALFALWKEKSFTPPFPVPGYAEFLAREQKKEETPSVFFIKNVVIDTNDDEILVITGVKNDENYFEAHDLDGDYVTRPQGAQWRGATKNDLPAIFNSLLAKFGDVDFLPAPWKEALFDEQTLRAKFQQALASSPIARNRAIGESYVGKVVCLPMNIPGGTAAVKKLLRVDASGIPFYFELLLGRGGSFKNWVSESTIAQSVIPQGAEKARELFEEWESNGVVPDFEVEGYEAWKAARKAAQQQEEVERQNAQEAKRLAEAAQKSAEAKRLMEAATSSPSQASPVTSTGFRVGDVVSSGGEDAGDLGVIVKLREDDRAHVFLGDGETHSWTTRLNCARATPEQRAKLQQYWKERGVTPPPQFVAEEKKEEAPSLLVPVAGMKYRPPRTVFQAFNSQGEQGCFKVLAVTQADDKTFVSYLSPSGVPCMAELPAWQSTYGDATVIV